MSFKSLLTGLLVFLIIIVFNEQANAGGELLPVGSRQAGMGRTSVSITDFWSVQNNQAGIALMDKIGVGISYESRFSISQLSDKNLAVVVPTGIGVLGLTVNHFGYELYSNLKIGLVYARSFGQYFRMGVQLDYLLTTLGDDYGSTSNVTFDLGIQSDVTKNLTIGAWVYNPFQVNLADYNNEKIPAIFRFGVTWKIIDELLASFEAQKSTNYGPVIFCGGLEYGFHDKFFVRGGFSTGEEIFSMGFGINIKLLRFDISAVINQTLGFTPQASLIFQF